MSFAELRLAARRDKHDAMSVAAVHVRPGVAVETELLVRRHQRVGLSGDMGGEGYAQVLEGVDSVIFDQQELDQKSLTLRRGDRVTLTDEGVVLILDHQHPTNGPIDVIWRAVRA